METGVVCQAMQGSLYAMYLHYLRSVKSIACLQLWNREIFVYIIDIIQ